MKTVRFAKVVADCGEPENHLIWTDPSDDKALQSAVKTSRVMTVMQHTTGGGADRGIIGLEPGHGRQFLLFPKSLRAFAGRTVVGIKYDLLHTPKIPASGRSPRSRPTKPPKQKPAEKKPPAKTPRDSSARATRSKKVIPFKPETEEQESDDKLPAFKKQVRRAMALLEDGKPVAAFNLLKRIVGG